ncbi:MerR family transcriptional regulator [Fodinicola feengrottensis]|uniref:MerR family transcriptional regulator n=1 Tax=Fodinicola feengrottensis TaxID=435914 RepID=A0ABP4V7X6_9ACTN|nr:MerR family transcriptional regulator [Fodinicola feengrottensis]
MITIGQLAASAGCTVKAVRHYHERGLLPEPERDASGYRRYRAEHAIALIKIRTLAEAGVPLSRVKELLAADEEQFAAAIADIESALRAQIRRMELSRQRVLRLRAGDELFVSAEIADYLRQLEELGLSERGVRTERDLWILMHTVSPDDAASWVAEKLTAMADPEFREIYRAYDAAYDWPADDPRLPALADRTSRWLLNQPPGPDHPVQVDPIIVRMLRTSEPASSPSWRRLDELLTDLSVDR